LLCDATSPIVKIVQIDKDCYADFLEDLYKGKIEIAYFPDENGVLTYKTYRRQFDDLKEMLDYLISDGFDLTYKGIEK
jgi:isopropylmalate/homocitrate/citramalate synthase